MTAGGGGSAVAGGSALHIPVLGRPVLDFLAARDGGVYIDGTFGAGGYTRAILAAADCKVIGIDRDRTAIALGFDLVDEAQGRLTLVEDRFSNLDNVARDCGRIGTFEQRLYAGRWLGPHSADPHDECFARAGQLGA